MLRLDMSSSRHMGQVRGRVISVRRKFSLSGVVVIMETFIILMTTSQIMHQRILRSVINVVTTAITPRDETTAICEHLRFANE
jgi:hypothetical protein